MDQKNILNFDAEKLKQVLSGWKQPAYHARQILSWIYKKGAKDFQQMTDLPLGLRKKLKENFYLWGLKLIKTLSSFDGTEKFLFALKDANSIEAVNIPCLLYTSPSPRDLSTSRMPSSA